MTVNFIIFHFVSFLFLHIDPILLQHSQGIASLFCWMLHLFFKRASPRHSINIECFWWPRYYVFICPQRLFSLYFILFLPEILIWLFPLTQLLNKSISADLKYYHFFSSNIRMIYIFTSWFRSSEDITITIILIH